MCSVPLEDLGFLAHPVFKKYLFLLILLNFCICSEHLRSSDTYRAYVAASVH